MQHRKIAGVLNAAGGMATLGILFIFYICAPAAMLRDGASAAMWIAAGFMAIAGVPYLAALHAYFRVCGNIGRDASFCRENIMLMNRIAKLLAVEAGLWLLALAVLMIAGPNSVLIPGSPEGAFFRCALAVLFILANLAVALVARMMAHLLNRAEELQAENDLTI